MINDMVMMKLIIMINNEENGNECVMCNNEILIMNE